MSGSSRALAASGRADTHDTLDGISLERRELIHLSLSAFAAWSLGWVQDSADASTPVHGTLSVDELIEHAMPMAERLVQSLTPNEEEYLRRVSGLIQRLSNVPAQEFDPSNEFDFVWTFDRFPITIAQLRLEPGASIPYHDHRDYVSALRVLEGNVRIRSFEIVGAEKQPSDRSTFQIRETRNEVLAKGQLSTLSRTRDNIHDIRTGMDGARLLDVFTYFSSQGASTYLNVDERSWNSSQHVYEASWQ